MRAPDGTRSNAFEADRSGGSVIEKLGPVTLDHGHYVTLAGARATHLRTTDESDIGFSWCAAAARRVPRWARRGDLKEFSAGRIGAQ